MLIKNKKIFFIFFTFCFLFNPNTFAEDVRSLIRVNNSIISNVDISNEIQLLKITYNNSYNLEQLRLNAAKNLIEYEIKKSETKNIELSEQSKKGLNEQINITYNQISQNLGNNNNFKKLISKKIEVNFKWNELIKNIYLRDINLNLNELEEISKKEKLDENQKNKLLLIEKNKKLNKFSISHYNKIKKNYIIKYL